MSDTTSVPRKTVLQGLQLLQALQQESFPLRVSIQLSRFHDKTATLQQELKDASQKYLAEYGRKSNDGEQMYRIDPQKALQSIAEEKDDPEQFLASVENKKMKEVLEDEGVSFSVPESSPIRSDQPVFKEKEHAENYYEEMEAFINAPCQDLPDPIPEEHHQDFLNHLEEIVDKITPQTAKTIEILLYQ